MKTNICIYLNNYILQDLIDQNVTEKNSKS